MYFCIFVGLFDQSLLGKKKRQQNLHGLEMYVRNVLARGGRILLSLEEAAYYFVQHAPNAEMI